MTKSMTPNQGHIAGLELALKEAQKAYRSTSGIAECRASGVFYKLEELISLAKSQPQSDAVTVPRELLERVAKPVLFTSQEDSHYDACTELRALLGGAA